MDRMFKELMEEMMGNSGKPKTEVRVNIEGEEEQVFTENFIVMHMGEDCGTVVGCVGPIELVKAVDMLMDSISNTMEQMTDCDKMMMSVLLMQRLKERIEND